MNKPHTLSELKQSLIDAACMCAEDIVSKSSFNGELIVSDKALSTVCALVDAIHNIPTDDEPVADTAVSQVDTPPVSQPVPLAPPPPPPGYVYAKDGSIVLKEQPVIEEPAPEVVKGAPASTNTSGAIPSPTPAVAPASYMAGAMSDTPPRTRRRRLD